MKINILGYILIAFVLVIAYKMIQESEYLNLKCIISDVDGKRYCVRDRSKLKLAANLLANINTKMNTLVEHVKEKYPDRENVKRLVKGYNPKKISETLPTSEYTAYSENKGEKIAFCLNTEKRNGKLIDENTLMFVATHELSHVATKSIGHTEEFWNNFKFLLKEADEIGVYKPEDYKKNSRRYCGTDIVDNPYYDL
ncbi:MAG: hypothetical protein CMD14_00840 [Flavobacteriales bacterium]|nr:hypothetical protein [Flavobacteriales bacterium]|tara:strand:+ start:302 stop:892 length:591 start_codon:yes stop_codon:yes gene_type:complete